MNAVGSRILLVDDDERNLELVEATLRRDGHEVVVARDGLAGQAVALDETFALILLDLRLPGRSGSDVCRALRAAGVRAPIIALSASVLPREVEETMRAGFDRFWPKPISPAELRRAVRELVETK